MNRFAVSLSFVALAVAAVAQEPPRRGDGERTDPVGRPAAAGRGAADGRPSPTSRPDAAARRRERLWRQTVEAMPPAERERFLRLPPAEKERAVREAVAQRAAAEEAAFLASLTDAERAELDAAASRPAERRRRFLELRLERHFRRATEEAKARGVLDDDEAARLAAAPAAERARAVLELQKRSFLAAHREDLAQAPRRERDRLAAVPAEEFFDDPFVQDFKSFRFLSRAEVEKFRALDDETAGRLVRALAAGEIDDGATSAVFSAERVKALHGLEAGERRRVGRDLRRAGIGPQRGLLLPPPELLDEMSEVEVREFLRQDNRERRATLVRKFGVRRLTEARRGEVQMRIGPRIAELLRKLPEGDQQRLLDLPPEEIRRELQGRFPEAFPPRDAEGPPPEGARPPRPGNRPPRDGEGGRPGENPRPGGGPPPGGRPGAGGRPPRGERAPRGDRPGRPGDPSRADSRPAEGVTEPESFPAPPVPVAESRPSSRPL